MTNQPPLFKSTKPQPRRKRTEIDERELQALLKEISTCDKCPYAQTRNTIVIGDGNPKANIWVVGECPGPDENEQGLPFIGITGRLLRKVLTNIGATTDKIYITNRVRCKPSVGLNPDNTALKACSPWLERQIEIVNPQVIVSIGKFSTAFCLGMKEDDVKITKLTGQKFWRAGRKIIPIFHPSYAKRRNMSAEEYQKHFTQLIEVLQNSPE